METAERMKGSFPLFVFLELAARPDIPKRLIIKFMFQG